MPVMWEYRLKRRDGTVIRTNKSGNLTILAKRALEVAHANILADIESGLFFEWDKVELTLERKDSK